VLQTIKLKVIPDTVVNVFIFLAAEKIMSEGVTEN
jgi:hypothetical protein